MQIKAIIDTMFGIMHTEPNAPISLADWLKNLNPAQQQAVTAPPGNVLILAGAGSGKTRVLVQRIAWIVNEWHSSPYGILAVTFTNKAAHEMKARLEHIIGHGLHGMWVGTFHGLSHRLLRLHWRECGLPEHFQVIDSDDQLQIIRKIFKKMNINEDRIEPKKAQSFINRKKDEGKRAKSLHYSDSLYDKNMQEIYLQYEIQCEENGLVDFAELLLKAFEILQQNEELKLHYQERFKHFLVDEFQDTNGIQYQWLKILTTKAASVTVVGDDDQSIYGWRGAKIENIQAFEHDYKAVTVIRLEQNYRSTSTILHAANALIMNNDARLGKTLWTESGAGELIRVYCAFNEEDEALYVVRQIKKYVEAIGSYQEIGILYRSNAQSRVLEEALLRAGIPYTIYGGLRYFERAEIKDALAYLRLSVNLQDNAAIERIINMPPRGIGDKSFEKIKEISQTQECSLWQAVELCISKNLITGRIRAGLLDFMDTIQKLQTLCIEVTLPIMMENVIQLSGLLRYYKEQKGERAQNRAENLEELVNATFDFEAEQGEEISSSTIAFLAYAALEGGERQSTKDNFNAVQMMTIHSAKGLEFPVVFITGMEESLFPHHFSKDSTTALEEERRLCYVGITRAKQQLFLCYAEKRRLFGRDEERFPSRFIREIPTALIEENTRRVKVEHQDPGFSFVNDLRQDAHESGFYLGQRVKHPKFGNGTVVDYEGHGDRTRIHVHFDMCGNKWLALSFAKLEAV